MFLLIEARDGTVEVQRSLRDDELLDPRTHAEAWAASMGIAIAPEDGRVIDGDICVTLLEDPEQRWHVWTAADFYLDTE